MKFLFICPLYKNCSGGFLIMEIWEVFLYILVSNSFIMYVISKYFLPVPIFLFSYQYV